MFSKRIQELQKVLSSHKLDYILVENPIDLLYFTGKHVSTGKLFVGLKEILFFVDGRYFEKIQQSEIYKAKLLSKEMLKNFFSSTTFNHLGFDGSFMTYDGYQKLLHFIQKTKPKIQLSNLPGIARNIRMIKDSHEITYLRKSAQLNWRGFEYICSLLKEGISEKTLAIEFELYCKKQGADELAFSPIVAFGPHTAIPHHTPSSRTLQKNDIVLIDCGVKVGHYCSDMTRVIFWGEGNPELEKIYSIVKRAQNMALSYCKPGIPISKLTTIVKEYFAEVGYAENFLHGLGHGLGLEIHEEPRLRSEQKDAQLLKPGMVLTIEPGIYLEGIGGVRYEDTIVITQEGHENLYIS